MASRFGSCPVEAVRGVSLIMVGHLDTRLLKPVSRESVIKQCACLHEQLGMASSDDGALQLWTRSRTFYFIFSYLERLIKGRERMTIVHYEKE